MKNKIWLAVLATLFALCLGLSAAFFRPGTTAVLAEVRSEGVLIKTVDLRINQSFSVTTSGGGENRITVLGGKIAVTEATCPDHYCMARGYCNSGAQIVCLPNRLIITFLGQTQVDAAAQ